MKIKFFSLALLSCLCVFGYTNCGKFSASKSSTASESSVVEMTPLTPRCPTPDGHSGTPETIEDIVRHINALPKPVTVDCFVQSLKRPIKVYAAKSPFSAQPSEEARSPRFFIFVNDLILSVVSEGIGQGLLEVSQLLSETRSIKAEIDLPYEGEMPITYPFDKVKGEVRTSCSLCHNNETRAAEITYADAFASDALKPRTENAVSLKYLLQETKDCDSQIEPERCELLNSVFRYGEVHTQEFPKGMRTL